MRKEKKKVITIGGFYARFGKIGWPGARICKAVEMATKVLSALLAVAIGALLILTMQKNTIQFEADFNNESDIAQTQR